jgi:hypothetical protein
MWNYRVAWFISLSAPGAVILPLIVVEALAGPHPGQLPAYLQFSALAYPAQWIFPVVLIIQLDKMLRGKRELMNKFSYIWAAVLVSLYFWTHFVAMALEQAFPYRPMWGRQYWSAFISALLA